MMTITAKILSSIIIVYQLCLLKLEEQDTSS
jgi:hypothetical protein